MEHLEGITVLNEYMTYETPWFVYLLCFLCVASALIALGCSANGKMLVCIIAFICFVILFFLLQLV